MQRVHIKHQQRVFKCLLSFSESKCLVNLSLSGNHFQSMHTVFCAIPQTLQEVNLSSCFTVDNGPIHGNNDDVNMNQLKSLKMQNFSELKLLNRIIKNESVLKNLDTLDLSNSDADRESLSDIFR